MQTIAGYWIDQPQDIRQGLRVSLESWNGNEQDDGVFYYTDGEPLTIGQRIAGDFIVTHIED